MRGKSHLTLGRLLAERYMPDAPRRYIRAFMIGCIEPDRNPTTYLKGSVRQAFLRGHNYENSLRYMCRVARRLEQKKVWRLVDYYTMGKLIHYTADAFTYAHNQSFGTKLADHREYEQMLQEHFLRYLEDAPPITAEVYRSAADAIRSCHRDYAREPMGIATDARFALNACCCVLVTLFAV